MLRRGFSILIFGLIIIDIVLCAPNCSKPPSVVNPTKIRQCCNGPQLERILREEFVDSCKNFIKEPNKPARPSTPSQGSTQSTVQVQSSTQPSVTSEASAQGSTTQGTSQSRTTNAALTRPPPDFSKAILCSAECLLNQTHVFNNGDFNKANALQLLNNVIKDDDFTSILESAMDQCATKATEKDKNFKRNEECGHFSRIYMNCVIQEAANQCPESRWLQSTNCNNVRNFIKACGVPETQK